MGEVNSMVRPELELATLIVNTLNLEVSPEDIDPDAPLFAVPDGDGWRDISKAHGVKLRSDDESNVRIFSSLRHLSDHIQQLKAA